MCDMHVCDKNFCIKVNECSVVVFVLLLQNECRITDFEKSNITGLEKQCQLLVRILSSMDGR